MRMAHASMRGRTDKARGFTLVELMVTIFLAAILITIAVPSFKHISVSSHLTTTANSLVGTLNAARMEAIKRNADVQFCGTVDSGNSSDLKTACGTNQPGAVYVVTGTAAASSAVLVQAAPIQTTESLKLPTVNAIQFDARGLAHLAGQSVPYSGTVAVVCSSAISSDNIRTITMITGSILETSKSDGDCQ
ncbi:MAG TPA: GspH/FimT family pseudopilin [Oleiagrimonas sp.]|nr:GspH/FimT family pseudopilin [Oleiagrimonas sp.]